MNLFTRRKMKWLCCACVLLAGVAQGGDAPARSGKPAGNVDVGFAFLGGHHKRNLAPNADPGELSVVVDGHTALALDLYRSVRDESSGNIVFSPYSISTAMAMVFAGARGLT